jgi:hypothetical protein
LEAVKRYLPFALTRLCDELWFGKDPVALDTMALKELMLQRRLLNAPTMPTNFAIYTNASLLELGVNGLLRESKWRRSRDSTLTDLD